MSPGVGRSVAQFAVVFRMLFKETTRELAIILGFTIVFPVGLLFFLNHLVAPDLRSQVLVGTIMLEMALLNINALAQSIGQDKQTREFDLWVSLPISPVVYVLGTAAVLLPFSIVSALITLAVAVGAFGLAIAWTTVPLLLLGLVLVWGSTMGIGYLIGVFGTSPRQISANAQIIGLILTLFTPVFYPVSALPALLQPVAYLWPLTWGAQTLVAILDGATRTALVGGIALAVYVTIWLVVIARGPRWREA